MAHYSEMDFLFSNQTNRDEIIRQLEQSSKFLPTDELNTKNLFKNTYTVYKQKTSEGTNSIKENYIKKNIYDTMKSSNPYVDILNYFEKKPALKIKAADLAYLKDLGVYPINRMVILRRFPEGCFVPENLDNMLINPISTVIGWIKPDQNFGTIGFNENWGLTNERFDVALSEILKKTTGNKVDTQMFPIPDFAQGLLFEFYARAGLVTGTEQEVSVDEYQIEKYNQTDIYRDIGSNWLKNGLSIPTGSTSKDESWGLNNIPVGNPNVLQEGPFRNPEGQNIQSTFSFDLETTYEQKLLGDVDPGSAMLDIIDNLLTMGTSNMVFYWGSDSPTVVNAKNAISNKANNPNAWWIFVSELMIQFWEAIKSLFKDAVNSASEMLKNQTMLQESQSNSANTSASATTNGTLNQKKDQALDFITSTLETILTSTIAIHRYRLRGSLELMIGGSDSSTPWYLTIGNPFAPWLATNHIIVKSGTIETSMEMGFNDQPQRITAKFNCQFSRSLGRQELLRMFNNSYKRNYTQKPTQEGETKKSGGNLNNSTTQNNP